MKCPACRNEMEPVGRLCRVCQARLTVKGELAQGEEPRAICPICTLSRRAVMTQKCGHCGQSCCVEHFDATNICPDCSESQRALAQARKEQPWENSLGMPFVPVANTEVLFCIWETRVQDYEAFVKETGQAWEKPSLEQGPTHPVVNVSWADAQAFCQWLTEKELKAGGLGSNQVYRLPTDEEWSRAVGLPKEEGTTPKDRDGNIKNQYPWGSQWPPPKGAGNYSQSLKVDDYEHTSPVGSFAANGNGLYDMGGNVWEWCDDWYDGEKIYRVLRGASWGYNVPGNLLSSYRNRGTPGSSQLRHRFSLCVGGAVFSRCWRLALALKPLNLSP